MEANIAATIAKIKVLDKQEALLASKTLHLWTTCDKGHQEQWKGTVLGRLETLNKTFDTDPLL